MIRINVPDVTVVGSVILRVHGALMTSSVFQVVFSAIMVLADLGRKITSALRSLSNATIINEEVTG